MKRRLGKRTVTLDSGEHILLDYALAGRSRCFAFHERRGDDYTGSRLLIEPKNRDLAAILRAALGWGNTVAYVIPRPKVDLAMEAWSRAARGPALREIETLSPYARIACEEWSDGGALRFWSTELSHKSLAKRLAAQRPR